MVLAALAALVGAAVQSATGFGFALVLSPALFAVMEPAEAVTVLLALGAALNLLVLLERHDARWSRLPPLILPALPGLALGAVVLAALSREPLQVGVGLAVIAAGLWQLRDRAARGPRAGSRCRLSERPAHHLDQHQRAAAGALAGGAGAAPCGVPRHAGGGVPRPQHRRLGGAGDRGRRYGRSRRAAGAARACPRRPRARHARLQASRPRALLQGWCSCWSWSPVRRAWWPGWRRRQIAVTLDRLWVMPKDGHGLRGDPRLTRACGVCRSEPDRDGGRLGRASLPSRRRLLGERSRHRPDHGPRRAAS